MHFRARARSLLLYYREITSKHFYPEISLFAQNSPKCPKNGKNKLY